VQIQSYYFGEELDVQEANSLKNCSLFANATTGSINDSFVTINLTLAVVDKVSTDKSNLIDVESDTLQIINDIYQVIIYSNRWQKWNVVDNNGSSITKLYDYTDSILAGWTIDISLKIKINKGICDLPFIGYDYEIN
jgi:hypothetical protein